MIIIANRHFFVCSKMLEKNTHKHKSRRRQRKYDCVRCVCNGCLMVSSKRNVNEMEWESESLTGLNVIIRCIIINTNVRMKSVTEKCKHDQWLLRFDVIVSVNNYEFHLMIFINDDFSPSKTSFCFSFKSFGDFESFIQSFQRILRSKPVSKHLRVF